MSREDDRFQVTREVGAPRTHWPSPCCRRFALTSSTSPRRLGRCA